MQLLQMGVGMFKCGLGDLQYTRSIKGKTGCYSGALWPAWVGWRKRNILGKLGNNDIRKFKRVLSQGETTNPTIHLKHIYL